MWDRDEEPDDAGDGEEYGGEEEAVVVAELGDGGGGGESTGGTGDFVEDMLDEVRRSDEPSKLFKGHVTYDSRVHPPELADVSTNDITWARGVSTSVRRKRGWAYMTRRMSSTMP